MGIALHLSHFHISDFLSPDLQNPHLAALTVRSSGNWSPMSGAHQNYRKLGYKILDPAPTRISGLWDKVQWTHRQQPKWYSYAKDPSALLPCRRIGSNYQKKKGAEIKKYKTSKSRQEKEPVLWDFPAPSHWFSLDVRMHKDEGIWDPDSICWEWALTSGHHRENRNLVGVMGNSGPKSEVETVGKSRQDALWKSCPVMFAYNLC